MSSSTVLVEKHKCPQCGKAVIHLAKHIKNMHGYNIPPEVQAPKVLEPVVEKEAQTPPLPLVEAAAPAKTPPLPLVEAAVKPSFAAAAAAHCPPMPPPLPPGPPPSWECLPKKVDKSVDAMRVVQNIFKYSIRACAGRKSEWFLLVSVWLAQPERFQITPVHTSPTNSRPRITVTVFQDEAHTRYSLYHIHMSMSAFAIASYIEGCDSGTTYKLVELMAQSPC